MIFNVSGGGVPSSRIVNNFDTTEAGFIADARALKTLNDRKLELELLWENAKPFGSFPPQTIAMDLSAYKFVLVRTIYSDGLGYGRIETVSVNSGTHLLILQPAGMNINSRQVVATSTGVQFAEGQSGGGTNNASIIPQAIYGIKGASA